MRRILNALREVAWLNVLAAALLVVGLGVAVVAVMFVQWAVLAVLLGIAGIGFAIIGK